MAIATQAQYYFLLIYGAHHLQPVIFWRPNLKIKIGVAVPAAKNVFANTPVGMHTKYVFVRCEYQQTY